MNISWGMLDRLAQEYGSSFYLLDLDRFRSNVDRFTQAFRAHYAHTSLGYSFKTNYLPALCMAAYERGAYAEVVSRMEYDLALMFGISAERIIFNGPLKRREDLEKALLNGSIINLDSPTEVDLVHELATTYADRSFTVGLRCNIDIGTDRRSRFGLDVDAGQIHDAFKILHELDNCSVVGLHFHSSILRTADSYATRTRKMLDICADLFKHQKPQYLDLGGGFFGNMPDELKEQFDMSVPAYEEYAESIAPLIVQQFGSDGGPELILEPGVAVVADVMQFVVRIVDVRTVGDRAIATTTGSIQNIKPAPNRINLPITVHKMERGQKQPDVPFAYELVGYTCMEMDVLHNDCREELARGDFVMFDQVGAYSIVFKPPFIQAAPPIVTYNAESGRWEVVRRGETLGDIMRPYVLPVQAN